MRKQKAIHVLYLTPYYYSKRGNAMTARRMKESLEKAGVMVDVFAYEEETGPVQNLMEKADIIHALHVARTADWLGKKKISVDKPLILTSGGTDINMDIFMSHKRDMMEQLLNQAEVLTVFTEDAKRKVEHTFPHYMSKTYVIPQGVPPSFKEKINKSFVLPKGNPNVLLPAGLRPVKDVLFPLEALDHMTKRYPDLQFILIGEVLDKQVERLVRDASAKRPWFCYHDPVNPEDMSVFYDWADVVLNTSESEGQPISLLEGMAEGVPVLARDNAGNQSVVCHGYNGFLFSTVKEFEESLQQLMADKDLYERCSEQAFQYVQSFHNPDEEAERYIKLYNQMIHSTSHLIDERG